VRWRVQLCAGPVLAIVFAIAIVPAKSASGTRLRTRETIFRPFTSGGKPAIRVRDDRGSCFSGSDTSVRSDAWRCAVGNILLDPCFSSAHVPGVVICPDADPTSGVEIRLTRSLPRSFANHGVPSASNEPWALELFSGAHCTLSSGATSVVDGTRLNYFCPGDATSGLWGYPRRTSEPWTILTAPFTATTLSQRVAVEHVWT
jgi:eukaryotic-like serine/threonine-protein kinase